MGARDAGESNTTSWLASELNDRMIDRAIEDRMTWVVNMMDEVGGI